MDSAMRPRSSFGVPFEILAADPDTRRAGGTWESVLPSESREGSRAGPKG
jgi:hypothetical protein